MTVVFAGLDTLSVFSRPGYLPPFQGYALLALSFVLSRTQHFRWGAVLATLMFPLVALSELSTVSEPRLGYLVYAVLAPFFAGMFLGVRASVLLSVINSLWIALLPILSAGKVSLSSVIDPLTANLIGGVVAVFYALRRDALEQRRLSNQRLHQEQLMQMQKMEALGRMAGGIAHDFNNLLTVIAGGVELLERKDPSRELKLIDDATQSARKLTTQLLTLSRQGVVEYACADLRKALQGAHQLLGRIIGEDVEVRVHVGADLHAVSLTQSQLHQILLNLATNARDAMPRGGVLTLSAHNRGDEQVLLTVCDTGHGMDETTCQKIFEPFFTTKPVGKGTGLGLSIVFGIVTGAGGRVTVTSRAGEGTEFSLLLRVAERQAERLTQSEHRLEIKGMARGRILLVEDDSAVRQLCRTVLRREGYEVLEAAGPLEALEMLSGGLDGVELVISDIVMPGMSGLEMVQRLRLAHPDLVVLFMSGYAPEEVSQTPLDARLVLQKPFRPTELVHRVGILMYGLDSHAPPARASDAPESRNETATSGLIPSLETHETPRPGASTSSYGRHLSSIPPLESGHRQALRLPRNSPLPTDACASEVGAAEAFDDDLLSGETTRASKP